MSFANELTFGLVIGVAFGIAATLVVIKQFKK